MKDKEKPDSACRTRSDDVIPDYDYLFEENTDKKGKRKTKFFSNDASNKVRACANLSFSCCIQRLLPHGLSFFVQD